MVTAMNPDRAIDVPAGELDHFWQWLADGLPALLPELAARLSSDDLHALALLLRAEPSQWGPH